MLEHSLPHEAYSEHCSAQSRTRLDTEVRVEVRRRGIVRCAVVLDLTRFADAREAEWYKVRHLAGGTGWYPCSAVRRCSGIDGRCTCIPGGDLPC